MEAFSVQLALRGGKTHKKGEQVSRGGEGFWLVSLLCVPPFKVKHGPGVL